MMIRGKRKALNSYEKAQPRRKGVGPALRGRMAYGSRVSVSRGFISPEYKFHDIAVDDAVIAAGNNILNSGSINLIAQGVTESQRIGRKCVIRSINWHGFYTLPTTATASSTSEVFRIIMYLDKQCNGATAAATDILEGSTHLSFNNLANKNRFVTMFDKTFTLSCGSGSGRGSTDTLSYGEVRRQIDFYKKCEIPIEFDSTAGAITEIRSNNLGVMACSGLGLGGMNSLVRLRFTDS